MGRYTTRTPEETAGLGARLAKTLKGGEVIAFKGGLGSGKTTFCRGLAAGLGSKDPVSSPTFAIAQLYRGSVPLAHFDAYRVAGEEDLEAAGFYEYIQQGCVVAVEWSENVREYLPKDCIVVEICPQPDESRAIYIEGAEGPL